MQVKGDNAIQQRQRSWHTSENILTKTRREQDEEIQQKIIMKSSVNKPPSIFDEGMHGKLI